MELIFAKQNTSMLCLKLEAGNMPPQPPSTKTHTPSQTHNPSGGGGANRMEEEGSGGERNGRERDGGGEWEGEKDKGEGGGCTLDVLAIDGIFLDVSRRQVNTEKRQEMEKCFKEIKG